jgi:peptidyl-prolyl cis-trans isomerase B (cyclophilin B)
MKLYHLLIAAAVFCMYSCAQKDKTTSEPGGQQAQTEMKTPVAVNEPPKPQTDTVQPAKTNQMIKITTSLGNMTIRLYDETPQHRDNFIKLTKQGYFNDLLFHRVIKDFMIQGGDPDSKGAPAGKMLGQGGPGYTVPAEFRSELIHKKGALAAARQADQVNPTKASSGSQFYIVQGKKWTDAELNQIEMNYGIALSAEQKNIYKTSGGTPFLDNNYTVFGEVVEGIDVIDKIAAVQKDRNDRPMQDIKMTVSLMEESK